MLAERHISVLWSKQGRWSVIGYRLGGARGKAPIAVPSGVGADANVPPAAASPIEGVLAVAELTCSVYEIGPPRAYVVKFTGGGLRFREGGGGWSPPVRLGVLHHLAVRRVGEPWVVGPMPGARLSFPDDAVLFKPELSGTGAMPPGAP